MSRSSFSALLIPINLCVRRRYVAVSEKLPKEQGDSESMVLVFAELVLPLFSGKSRRLKVGIRDRQVQMQAQMFQCFMRLDLGLLRAAISDLQDAHPRMWWIPATLRVLMAAWANVKVSCFKGEMSVEDSNQLDDSCRQPGLACPGGCRRVDT